MKRYCEKSLLNFKDNFLILNKDLIKKLGWDELGMLQELICKENYCKKNNLLDDEGFFSCTSEEIKDIFGWSWDKQKKILNRLEHLNLIILNLKGIPFKRYFKINKEVLKELEESEYNKDKRKSNIGTLKHIYLLQSESLYKIGIAKDVDSRWKSINNLPYEVNIISYSDLISNPNKIEAELHNRYKNKRVNGEWFSLDPEEVEEVNNYIRSLKNSY